MKDQTRVLGVPPVCNNQIKENTIYDLLKSLKSNETLEIKVNRFDIDISVYRKHDESEYSIAECKIDAKLFNKDRDFAMYASNSILASLEKQMHEKRKAIIENSEFRRKNGIL